MKSTLARITLLSFLFLLFIPQFTSAEMKTFIKEYTYQASEDDSRNSSRTLALREVKRLLLEELGTYLESITEVQNFQLTKDQITTLTAGIVMTKIVDEKWDGRTYWLKAKVAADSGAVIKSLDALRKDRVKTKELEKLRKRSDDLLEENTRLRKEMIVKKGKAKRKTVAAYNKTIQELSIIEWHEIGKKALELKNYTEAIDAFTKAIKLNPKHQESYIYRGIAHVEIGKYTQALIDYDRAIELDPKSSSNYQSRGEIYEKFGKYDQAIKDYTKGIKACIKGEDELKQSGLLVLLFMCSDLYHNRGSVYDRIGKYTQAIIDYDRAIELNPEKRDSYYTRGITYHKLGKTEEAFRDYETAARLGNVMAQDYLKKHQVRW